MQLAPGRACLSCLKNGISYTIQLAELEGKDVLIYKRSLSTESRLSFGIPLADIWIRGFDFSAHGRLVRYDLLLLFFTPDGILREIVSEKGSHYPYLKTILS